MKIILILYVIGIILYWLGIASLISTIKKIRSKCVKHSKTARETNEARFLIGW